MAARVEMRVVSRFLFSFVATILSLTSIVQAQTQTPTPPMPLSELRTQIGIRLDRTAPTSLASSDKGSAILALEIQNLVSEMAAHVAADHLPMAAQTLENLFSLIPNSDRAFAYLLPLYPTNAPTIVHALRRAIRQAGHIVMADSTLRIKFLDLVGERIERHSALAPANTRYLEIFGTWTSAVMEWRYLLADSATSPLTRERIKEFVRKMPSIELEKMAEFDRRYKRIEGAALFCPNLFKIAR